MTNFDCVVKQVPVLSPNPPGGGGGGKGMLALPPFLPSTIFPFFVPNKWQGRRAQAPWAPPLDLPVQAVQYTPDGMLHTGAV